MHKLLRFISSYLVWSSNYLFIDNIENNVTYIFLLKSNDVNYLSCICIAYIYSFFFQFCFILLNLFLFWYFCFICLIIIDFFIILNWLIINIPQSFYFIIDINFVKNIFNSYLEYWPHGAVNIIMCLSFVQVKQCSHFLLLMDDYYFIISNIQFFLSI